MYQPIQAGRQAACASKTPCSLNPLLRKTVRPTESTTVRPTRIDETRLNEWLRGRRVDEVRRLGAQRDGQVKKTVALLGWQQRHAATKPPNHEQITRSLCEFSDRNRLDILLGMRPEYRRWLAREESFVTRIASDPEPGGFARIAAHMLLDVGERVTAPISARSEAIRLLSSMLRDKETASRLLLSGVSVTVVPKNVAMTEIPAFSSKKDLVTPDGRSWAQVRGSGGRHTAITEENLLGDSIGEGTYDDGYSTTTHEFAHTIHQYGMSESDKGLISHTYARKLQNLWETSWPDGPLLNLNNEPTWNYSSTNELEFFAQLTNCYLGANGGFDSYTGRPRNNGSDWVRTNEPELVPILERLYGRSDATKVNPVHRVRKENETYEAMRLLFLDTK